LKIAELRANMKIFYYSLHRQFDVIRWSIKKSERTNSLLPKFCEHEILQPDEEFIPGIYAIRCLFPENEIRTSATFSNQFLFNFYNSYTFSQLCAKELIDRNYFYCDPVLFRNCINYNFAFSMLMIFAVSVKLAVNSNILPHIHYPKSLNYYPIKLYKIPLRIIVPYIIMSTLAHQLQLALSPLTTKGMEFAMATSWIKPFFKQVQQERSFNELPPSLLPFSYIITHYPGENVWITRLKNNIGVPSKTIVDVKTKFEYERNIRLA
jgi:hypothetical protein